MKRLLLSPPDLSAPAPLVVAAVLVSLAGICSCTAALVGYVSPRTVVPVLSVMFVTLAAFFWSLDGSRLPRAWQRRVALRVAIVGLLLGALSLLWC